VLAAGLNSDLDALAPGGRDAFGVEDGEGHEFIISLQLLGAWICVVGELVLRKTVVCIVQTIKSPSRMSLVLIF
jgi:hypothetical protein